jgi:hypothetical protein
MQPLNPSNTGILHRINELRENAFAEDTGDDECMADLFELVSTIRDIVGGGWDVVL